MTLAAALLAGAARVAAGQQADVIRGRVQTQQGAPIGGAQVEAVSIPGRVTRAATADAGGRFTISIAAGDGDYWVTVRALGYAAKRFEVKRLADEQILVADATLATAAASLDAIRIVADRARPERNGAGGDAGNEKTVNVTTDPSQAGNLAAIAASAPGVQLVPGTDGNPDQFSVFGLGADQNSAALNGLGFGATDIPRDAAVRASLNTSPWDVSRGGFSGAQLSLSTISGSNFSSRAMSSLLNSPILQWTDRGGRALGAEFRSASVGAAMAGPVSLDKSFYSIGYQFDRRMADMSNLATADPVALGLAGVAPDSLARLRTILSRNGVPTTATGLPATRTTDRALVMGSFDLAPATSTSGQALNVTAVASYANASSPFAQVTAFPSNDVRAVSWFGGLQLRHTNYFSAGVLSETSIGASLDRRSADPYLALPNGGVRVSSALDDGSSAVAGLTFGGSQVQRTLNTGSTISAQNQLSWFSGDNRHRIKLSFAGRLDGMDQDLTTNSLGTFRFNSLADLEAGQPAMYTRSLAPRTASGREVATSISIGDSFRPASTLQFDYGVRADRNDFLRQPEANDALSRAFGVENDRLPNRTYLSPRVGFAWTYGQAAQIPVANGFVRGPRAVVRGGIGIFQNVPLVQLAGSALANTGLADARRDLTCVGSAAPSPNWAAYAANPASIPTVCADGTVFSSTVPNVSLFAHDYAAQRSVRSNVSWSGPIVGDRLAATHRRHVLARPAPTRVRRPELRRRLTILARERGWSSRLCRTDRDRRRRPAPSHPSSRASIRRSDSCASSARASSRSIARSRSRFSRWCSARRYSWRLAYSYSNTRDDTYGFMSTGGDPRSDRNKSRILRRATSDRLRLLVQHHRLVPGRLERNHSLGPPLHADRRRRHQWRRL